MYNGYDKSIVTIMKRMFSSVKATYPKNEGIIAIHNTQAIIILPSKTTFGRLNGLHNVYRIIKPTAVTAIDAMVTRTSVETPV